MASLVRPTLLSSLLLLVGCATTGPGLEASVPASPRGPTDRGGRAPPAPPPLEAEGLAGDYSAEFAVSIESSCSQSWDVTTWGGVAELRVQTDGAASLELRFDSRSVGGSWQGGGGASVYESEERACRWEGRAVEVEGRTRIALTRTAGEDSMCARGYVSDEESGPELELLCDRRSARLPVMPVEASDGVGPGLGLVRSDELERVEVEVLSCSADARVPHLVRYLIDPGDSALRLGIDRRLHITSDELGLGDKIHSLVVLGPTGAP